MIAGNLRRSPCWSSCTARFFGTRAAWATNSGGAWQSYWTAHVGSYRVIYRILDDAPVEQTPGMVALREPESGTVTVVRIRRRADAYHGGPG